MTVALAIGLEPRGPDAVVVEAGAAAPAPARRAGEVAEVDGVGVGQARRRSGAGSAGRQGRGRRRAMARAARRSRSASSTSALATPGRLAGDVAALRGLGGDVDAVDRADLDGDLAQDVGLPVARGVADQRDRAERQAGEEAHDGDDDGQRVAGDGVLRHELGRLAQRPAAPGGGRRATWSLWARSASVIDGEPPFLEDQAPRIELVHQGDVVGGDDDRRAEPVEFDEQAHQAARRAAGRRCRSARRRGGSRAGRSARGRSPRAASRRRRGPAGRRACGRRGRPSAAARRRRRGSSLPRLPSTRSGRATFSNVVR